MAGKAEVLLLRDVGKFLWDWGSLDSSIVLVRNDVSLVYVLTCTNICFVSIYIHV